MCFVAYPTNKYAQLIRRQLSSDTILFLDYWNTAQPFNKME